MNPSDEHTHEHLCEKKREHVQVCNSLGVPLEVVPMTDAYWERVVSHSVAEIREGRTPNPDMLCNSRVKVRRGSALLSTAVSLWALCEHGHRNRPRLCLPPIPALRSELASYPIGLYDLSCCTLFLSLHCLHHFSREPHA